MCRDVVCSGDDTSVAVIATPNIQIYKNMLSCIFADYQVFLRELK
jgi:hypothetical protein